MFLEGVHICECCSRCMKSIKKQLTGIILKSSITRGLDFPQEAEMSQSKLRPTMRTHPSIDTELLADWDLAWDYTPGLDLTFLVFFECKHAHRPTCRGLTPLLKKKRADPMLSDPNLPRLPLPTATSLCSPSLFFFKFQWPPSTHPSTPHLAWEPTPVALPRHHHHHTLCLH